jgi:hypothetical protein
LNINVLKFQNNFLDLQVRVVGGSNGTFTPIVIDERFFGIKQKDARAYENAQIKGSFQDKFMFTWQPIYGETLTYIWIEQDDTGHSVTINPSVTITQGGVTAEVTAANFTIRAYDKQVGNHKVWKNEPALLWYGSQVEFQLMF